MYGDEKLSSGIGTVGQGCRPTVLRSVLRGLLDAEVRGVDDVRGARNRLVDIVRMLPTEFFIEPDDVIALSCGLWIRQAGTGWVEIGPEECESASQHHWLLMPPVPSGTEFAYSLSVGGCAGSFWRVKLGVRQRISSAPYGWTTRQAWTEAGVIGRDGSAGGSGLLEDSQFVRLRAAL